MRNMEAKGQTHVKDLIYDLNNYTTRLLTRYRRLVAGIVLTLAEACWEKTKAGPSSGSERRRVHVSAGSEVGDDPSQASGRLIKDEQR